MNKQTYYYVVAGVFLVVAIAHLVRAFSGWEMIVGGVVIPLWLSCAAALVIGYLAYRGYSFGKKM